jgi:hypothetical protein
MRSSHRLGRTAVAFGLIVWTSAGIVRAQVWEVDDVALSPSVANDGSEYGHALAVGDFDADGVDDLAVAAPGTHFGGDEQAGRLQVYLGGSGRVFAVRIDRFPAGGGDGFRLGTSIVAGNFDDTPQDELAVGAPGRVDGGAAAGEVFVFHFDADGDEEGFFWFGQTDLPSPAGGAAAVGDEFGHALAAGDFDGDGFEDLAIGAPRFDHSGPVTDAGRLYVVYGSASGLALGSAQGIPPAGALPGARYGEALAAGDFDDDGHDDLAVGEPGREIGGQAAAGRVEVLLGSSAGIDLATSRVFSNGSFGITHEAGDEFGATLVAGDFDRGAPIGCLVDACTADLAIGSPLEDVGTAADAGIVIVVYSVAGLGPDAQFAQVLDQSDLGFDVEAGDRFGGALAGGQLDTGSIFDELRGGHDLAIGAPGEDVAGGAADQGVIHLLFAYATEGLDPSTGQVQQQFAGYASGPGAVGDRFGSSLAIGDFDGDGAGDLACGVTGRENGAIDDAGVVQVLWGALFADGFERSSTGGWSAAAP